MPTKAKKHPLFSTWREMKRRCSKPNNGDYPRYGALGVTVCERWTVVPGGFWNFVADVGPKPAGDYSIDRIDPAGGYEPGNVRWATRSEQNKNKRPLDPSTLVMSGAKLTPSKVAIVKAMYRTGRWHRHTAQTYSVSKRTIESIARGLSWTWVQPAALLPMKEARLDRVA